MARVGLNSVDLSALRRSTRHCAAPMVLAVALAWAPAAVSQAQDPDLNDDGVVNILDVTMVSPCLGQTPAGSCAIADTDGDGDVDMADLNYVIASYGQSGFPIGSANQAPKADAGPDRTVSVGSTVTLSGAASSDHDGDSLGYTWSFQYRPPGSVAVISDPASVSPSFLVDVPGTYVAQLIVNDGTVSSALDIALISTNNSIPVANAGMDRSTPVNTVVTLDGSGSSDADGNLLTYAWSLLSVPAGSTASLSDPAAVSPTLRLDLPGTYVAALVVNDGLVDSAPDQVTISTGNSAPVAAAGPDQSVYVGDEVTLDGSGSSDVDGNLLTFAWSISSAPPGSTATLSDPAAVKPTFTVDRPGDYVIQLVINDGSVDSLADTVVISTLNSAPVADAGADVTARVGDSVLLDGTGSSDDDFDPLTFRWAVTSRPSLSTAVVSDPESALPALLIDRPGTYVVQLVVNDGRVDSAPESVTVTTVNSKPVADAGDDQDRLIGERVVLDGSGSSDVDLDPLTFTWAIIARPAGSATELSGTDSVAPELVPDRVGTYVVQLVVNDGSADSVVDTVTVEAGPPLASLLATPVRGGVPLEVSFTGQMAGGFPPYTFAWDVDGDGTLDDSRANFVQLYQAGGNYLVTLTVSDSRGFVSQDSQLIEALVAPQVVASGEPTEGTAPLDVAFSAVASDADGAVVRYEWDFNGDGVIDQVNASTASGAFRYEVSGRYEATLTVTDNDGISASDTVIVSVGVAPQLDASVTPLSGDAPLDVTFSASATDPDGTVVRYEWDFEGDGVVDYSDPASGNTTHSYVNGGVYPANIKVFDDTGLIATRTFIVSVAGPPVSLPRAFPTSGQAPLTVTFFSDGTDFDGGPEYYDWDFNGDGVRDVRLIASMNTTYTYTTAGSYLAELKVVDNDGLTGTATVQIEVQPGGPQQTIPSATALARPASGGAPLHTSLIGAGSDPNGNIVEYAWDFDGDGTYDFVDPVAAGSEVGLHIDAGSYAAPVLHDMDGDGDRDLAIGNSSGYIQVFTNAGSDAGPDWMPAVTLRNPAGAIIDVGSYAEPAMEDMDGDGDLDMLVGNSDGQIYLLENTGSTTAPAWTLGARLLNSAGAIIDVGSYANLLPLDYDADGDRDLIVGNSSGELRLYLRSGTAGSPLWTDAGLLQHDAGGPIDVGSYAAPMLLPVAAPGLPELLVGNSTGTLSRFVNIGSATVPVWQDNGLLQTAAATTIDLGSYANPMLFDLSADGGVQLLAGDSNGLVTLLSMVSGGWEVTRAGYNRFDVGNYAAPSMADIDGDSDLDLLTGNSNGEIYLRRNVGTSLAPAWFPGEVLVDGSAVVIDVGSYAAPAFADLDGDGDFDIIVGDSAGRLRIVRNSGDALVPLWTAEAQVLDAGGALIDVGSYAAPLAVDIDRDGDLDLLVGNSGGTLEYIRNDGDASAPSWVRTGNVVLAGGATLDVGSYAVPAVYDPDHNGTLDLLVGHSGGLMLHFDNHAADGLDLIQRPGFVDGLDVGSYASPVLADIDDDGDADLLVGDSSGLVNLYRRYGQVSVDYPVPGAYDAILRVTDNSGESATDTVTINVLQPGSPSAIATASVVRGDAPLAVDFNGQGFDPDGSIVEYAWDFDGDGIFDALSTADGIASHTYSTAGIYNALLRVTDDAGLSATDSVRIEVGFALTPSVGTISFNPGAGEVGAIQTVIEGGEAVVTVRIVDGQGKLVKTLVNGALRGPGIYQDPWSGSGENGQRVTDGAYYAVVEYSYDGETRIVDLRDQAVFEELTPSRSFSGSFNPYEGQPVSVSYQIPWPAEVSLYFWTRDNSRPGSTIAPVRTLFLRLPRPPGAYTDVWDGFDDNGVVVNPGQQYPVTLWLYRLPPNVIMVSGNRPELTAIDVVPRYLSPSFNPYAGGPPPSAVVTVASSKDATLQAQIVNQAGLVVRRLSRENRPAGVNTLTWDGRDSEGNLVAPGTYSIGVTAIDAVGNRSLSRYAAVTVRY